MTVCIASAFMWQYGPNDYGRAIITASDRQITAQDVEYEPPQVKVCFLTPKVLILIAGDYTAHSEALVQIQRRLAAEAESDVGIIAELYAEQIRKIKARRGAQFYLSPVGLDLESFLLREVEFSEPFSSGLKHQLQSYRGDDTEAIICGHSDVAHIYVMDTDGKVLNYDDVGFAAIGIGAWHAKSQLMRARYSSQWIYPFSLALTYTAKKIAEIAPGVGEETDMFLITRAGWEPVLPPLMGAVNDAYQEYEKKRTALAGDIVLRLGKRMDELRDEANAKAAAEAAPQGNAEQSSERKDSAAPEAAGEKPGP